MDHQKKTKEHLLQENKELNENISSLEKTLADLREQLSFYQILLETLPNPAFYKDTGGRFLWCNKAFEEYHGVSREELYGKKLIDIKPNYYEAETSHKSDMELIAHPGETIYEVPLTFPNGTVKTIISRKATLKKEDGSAAGIVGVQIEITEHKKFEEELRQREAKLNSIFRAVPTGIGVVSNRMLLDVNDRICEMTGYAKEELVGQSARILYPTDEDFEYVGTEKYRQIAEKGTGTVETLWQCKDGKIINVLLSSTPIDPGNLALGVTFTALNITERKRVEEALKESELFLKESHRIARLGGWKANPNTDYLEWTEGVYEIIEAPLDYKPSLSDGLKFFLPQHIPIIKENVINCLNTGKQFIVECEATTSSGRHLWTEVRGLAPVVEGERSYVIGTFQDVTERKLAEEAIRTSRKQLLDIIDFLPDATLVIDKERRILVWNKAIEKMTGIPASEMVGKGGYMYTIPFYGEARKSLMDLLFEESKDTEAKYPFITREGDSVIAEVFCNALYENRGAWVFAIASPLYDQAGNIIGAIESIRDISERKMAEKALRESEEKYKSLFENAVEGFFQTTAGGRFLSANPFLAKLLGFSSPQELIETLTNIGEQHYANPQDRITFKNILESQGNITQYETKLLKKDGTLIWASINARAVRDEKGSILYYEGTLEDITERKQAEEELREERERLDYILSITGTGIDIVDGEFNLHFVDKGWQKIYGDPAGRKCYEYFKGLSEPCPECGIPIALKTKQVTVTEEVLPLENNRVIEVHIIPFQNAEGQWLVAEFNVDITKRKLAEEALIEKELKFRTLFENANDAIFIMKDGIFLDCNPKTLEIYRCRKEDIIGHSPAEFSPEIQPDGLPSLKKAMDKMSLALSGEPQFFEWEHTHLDGTPFDAEVSLNSIEFGGHPYLQAMVRDISKRKRAEEELRVFMESVENSSDAIGISTPEGKHFYQNKAFDELFGQVGENPSATVYVDEKIGQEVFRTIIAGGQWTGEVEMYSANRTILTVFLRAYASKDKNSQIKVLVGVHANITANKLSEKALGESERRYRDLYENLRDGSAAVDKSGRIVDCNRRFLDMVGYTFDEVKNLTYEDITPARWHVMELKILQEQVDKRGYSDIYEKEYIHKDGRIFPVEIQTYLISGPSSETHSYWAFVRDITERKLAEKEKESLQAKLIQAQKMESVGRLAGGVAHDFNNMLNVILGYTELAMEEVEPAKPLYSYLDEIRKSAQRSTDLTRQLLAFARKQTIAPRVLDLNETIDGMLKILRRLIGEDINLVWKPGAELWRVKIDPSQVDQLLANLCVNARDAISGVGKVTIETENIVFDEDYCAVHIGFVPGEYVMLAVSDDGIGMNKEVTDHLFEPFFTTKDFGKGTGLGLATVYGIVKQNHGFINVYSEPGKGSSFKIYVPRYDGEDIKQKADSLQETPKGRGELVLMVEDDAAMLKVSLMMLETLGYRVLVAGNPGEAIRLAKENVADLQLLMTDVIMPEMNGKELAKLVDKIKPGLKCLFASGYTANVIAHHGVLNEGVNFIQKPFSMQDLASKVREVLDFKKK